VERVQADEGIVGGAEEIGADGEAVVIDEALPFATSFEEKDSAEKQGDEPPETEEAEICFADGSNGGVNRETAGEQTNRGEDGEMEDFARRRAGKALADVKEVGDDENGEDGGLCGDETSHADMALIGERPLGVERGDKNGERSHRSGTSVTSSVEHLWKTDVPGLRCWGDSWNEYPAVTRLANFCRAAGAGFRVIVVGMEDTVESKPAPGRQTHQLRCDGGRWGTRPSGKSFVKEGVVMAVTRISSRDLRGA